MEIRPIDANALLRRRRNFGKDYALDPVDKNIDDQLVDLRDVLNAPTLDYAPVRHGEWEWDTMDVYMCSACSEKSHVKEVLGKPAWDYCPNYGAKMDGKEQAK